jgi:trimethylamine--corrinoid protein Co-methyltransferase
VNIWGLSSSSRELDALYGHEATIQGLLATLAGADEIYSIGLIGSSQTLCLDKMVLDNHLTRQIETLARPFPLDEEHLQAGLIERVGIGGHYLGQRETRALTRREYVPVWPPRDVPLLDLAHQEAVDILHNHQPPPLPAGAEAELERILAEAGRALSRRTGGADGH